MPEIKICTAYEIDGRRVTDFPSHVDDLRRAEPVYETLPGWQQRHDRRAADGRFAGGGAGLSGPAERAGRPAGGGGFGGARPRADDFRTAGGKAAIQWRTAWSRSGASVDGGRHGTWFELRGGRCPKPPSVAATGRRAAGGAAAAHRHHHGRQRPLGAAAGLAAHRGASPRRGQRPPHDRGLCRSSTSSSSRSIACRAKTGSGRRGELDFLMHLLEQYMIEERSTIMEQNIASA